MIAKINKITSNASVIDKAVFLLFALFPLSAILGNLLLNLTFIIIFLIFIVDTIVNKDYHFLKDITFWILTFFFYYFIGKSLLQYGSI
ncbi:hypothetical protein IDH10_00155 [Pelagibacterales bacterium SAG-MED20]|nr:hypothetical protein [Pelagibacterales bacterium SAG-MED20]